MSYERVVSQMFYERVVGDWFPTFNGTVVSVWFCKGKLPEAKLAIFVLLRELSVFLRA